jgi:hypothetical protein
MSNDVKRSANPLSFMLANWYSGATLLALVAARHSQIECNGESLPFSPRDDRRYDCTCGEYLDTCDFFRFAAAHMWSDSKNDWNRALFCQVPDLSGHGSLNRLLRSGRSFATGLRSVARVAPPIRRREQEFVRAHLTFFDRAVAFSDRSHYLDGTKSLRRTQLFLENTDREIRVVHLVRDGRAFANSYRKNRHMDLSALPEAAERWNSYIADVDRLDRQDARVKVLTIRYEDLCRGPEGFLHEMLGFLDVRYEPLLEQTRSDLHVLGNRMRRSFGNEIREDRSWETELGRREIAQLEELMGESLSRFKYV